MEENNKIELYPNEEQVVEEKIVFEKVENEELSRLKISADIFGVSTRELESEFIDYKISKLLKSFDYLIDENTSELEIKRKIQVAKGMGFGSITVLPTMLENAKKYIGEKGIELNSLVAYPFGEEYSSVKVLATKQLAKTSVNSISTPITPLMLNFYRLSTTANELKKMRKASKNKKLKAIVQLSEFNQQTITALIKMVKDTKIDAICVDMDETSIPKLKSLFDLSAGSFDVEVIGEISLKLGVATLNYGAKKISAKNAEKLAEELISKLR